MKNPIDGIEVENQDFSKIGILILALASLFTNYSSLIILLVISVMIIDVILNNLDQYKKQIKN